MKPESLPDPAAGSAPAPPELRRARSRGRASAARVEHRHAALGGGTPGEVLARIVPGDPLELRPLVARTVRSEALLVDGERAHLRALALCASGAASRPAALDRWLEEQVARAVREVADEQSRSDRDAPPTRRTGALEDLARTLGLSLEHARAACVAFNRLPRDQRSAFLRFAVEGRALEELAGDERASAVEVARRARRALETLTTALRPASGDGCVPSVPGVDGAPRDPEVMQ